MRDTHEMEPEETELRRRFAVRSECFEHGTLRLELLVPASADALIDEQEFDYDERLPYWAELWPSARALARHLWDAPVGGDTLELGAGLALPSLALLARGTRTLATDYYDDALRFARVNAARNGLSALPTRLVDWRDIPTDLGRWPRLIAADVLYERRNIAPLLAALQRLLQPAGTAVIADPGRTHLPEFRARAASEGWRLREWVAPEPTPHAARGVVDVRLLELTRA